MLTRKLVAAAATALLSVAIAVPAHAKCTRLGFSVNDYGKDGPTKDAKALLDTYIAKWAAENSIAKYRTGAKDVKCELFLNFIVFDEHTCRAEADVCWNEGPAATKPTTADAGEAGAKKATAKKAESKPELTAKPKTTAKAKAEGADITTGTIEAPKADAAKKAAPEPTATDKPKAE